MFKEIQTFILSLEKLIHNISPERRSILDDLANILRDQDRIDLNFICTHNSRRSQLAQVWYHVLSNHFNLKGIRAFSGGTERTDFHINARSSLERTGFKIKELDDKFYQLFFSDNSEPVLCFSKKFDDRTNPKDNFIAVMTCSDAEKNCPYIPGADKRISLKYDDPKISDGTAEESDTYDARSKQIASEIYYVLNKVKNEKA